MCGLTGFIDFTGRSDESILKDMSQCLHHRGPDDSGYDVMRSSGYSLGFGFKRLAILDLSPAGHQPMKDESGNWIIFNGEVYNYREIRESLIAKGYSFRSSGDTEVILAAYCEWGINCLEKFIGMFSIVLYDDKKQKLILARDRAGVKPLFYYHANDNFLFSSELKAFHRHPSFKKKINPDALAYFFQHGYISSPSTIFENTFQLVAGCYLELDLRSRNHAIVRYWDLVKYVNKGTVDISYNEAVEQTEMLLVSACNYRMIADVPVGVFLSGGYDSSCVAALLQHNNTSKIRTFTIGFEEESYNEAPYAAKVASHLGTDHHEYYCTYRDAKELIPKLADIYDQPFGDSSAIPTTLISGIARQHVTVALSADGGDELFAGYPRHRKSLAQIQKFKTIPDFFRRLAAAIIPGGMSTLIKANRYDKLRSVLSSSSVSEQFDIINQAYTLRELSFLLTKDFKPQSSPFQHALQIDNGVEDLNAMLATDYMTYLVDDIMQKVDRASMSVSLEAREPLLDHRLAEFMAVIPSTYKMDPTRQKKILKDIVHKYIPREIMERPKMGFGIPVNKWLAGDLKDLFMDFMSDDALRKNEFLNLKQTGILRDGYLQGRVKNFERVWFVFMFQMWMRRWM